MGNAFSPTAVRLAGVAALFVAFGALLVAENGDLSRRQAGAIALVFGLAMIALHVAIRRARIGHDAFADASLAALAAALTVPSGLTALMWDPGIGNAIYVFLFRVSSDGSGNALLVSAGVFAAAYALARDARWLLIAPLALVGGIEFHLVGNGAVTVGNGSWKRFLVLLAAASVLAALASRLPPAERDNVLLAAALLVPFAFLSYPWNGAGNVKHDLVGAALLAGLTLATWRRMTPGIAFAIVLTAGYEVFSLASHGESLVPAVLFATAGVMLLLVGSIVPMPRRPEPAASTELT
jgi:hypothetical protein